jgi:hypothetical protein
MVRLRSDCLHRVRSDLLVVELIGAALRNQSGGDIAGQKVLELNIAGAVEQTGRRKINGADSPQTDSKNDRLGANAARGKPLHG